MTFQQKPVSAIPWRSLALAMGLLVLAAPTPARSQERHREDQRPSRSERDRSDRDRRGGPFDYIEETDRLRENQGRPLPGQRVVRVESRNGRRQYYRVNTEDSVQLYRNLSGGRARRGVEWGYDSRGVWVDRGLRAEFLVGRPDRRPSRGDRWSARGDRPPAWSLGTFRGRDSARDAIVTITIRPDGTVLHRTDFDGNRPTVNQRGYYEDGRLRFEDATLDLDRSGRGIYTAERGGRRSRITYRRID